MFLFCRTPARVFLTASYSLLINDPREINSMMHNLYFLYSSIIDPLLTIDYCSVTNSRFNDPMIMCNYFSIHRLKVIHEFCYEKTKLRVKRLFSGFDLMLSQILTNSIPLDKLYALHCCSSNTSPCSGHA